MADSVRDLANPAGCDSVFLHLKRSRTMNLTSNRTILLLIAITAALILTACGGGAPSPIPPTPTAPAYSVGVTPLSDTEASAYLSIVNPEGAAPCGVFNVGGHGPKIALL